MPVIPVLTALCGQPPAPVQGAHGDFLAWFKTSFGSEIRLVPWRVAEGEMPPPLDEFAGLLVSGSAASLTEPEAWMEVAIESIREASERELPTLGVCFGHQLIGCAFGAATVTHVGSEELGCFDIDLTELGAKDPLFAGLPSQFTAPCMHYDQVDPGAVSYSNGLQVLASSPACPVQALAGGKAIRSVQFHPEFRAPVTASYLQHKEVVGRIDDAAMSLKIFSNWVDHWLT